MPLESITAGKARLTEEQILDPGLEWRVLQDASAEKDGILRDGIIGSCWRNLPWANAIRERD
ncbi:hypothetical protein [Citrobacter sp. JGM124]|uniref:hypothetical protein n=1 Tax=Citrobacter sp. JGM124 TaxID=2799789 RepID=UPI001BA93FB7|nr:hypothetical protein [Citrobacter sp. JGM124]MBS0846774.1 hypothetical protein [Citrobacter sp. JGM124]